jgi:exodeoxyribonuclease-5
MGEVRLSPEQQEAAAEIWRFIEDDSRRVFTMHGLAGTGKTTVLADVARDQKDALLCTLTGKAASVLRRKTGLDTQTIHSAFYQLEKVSTQNGRREMSWREAHSEGALSGAVVLLDECSMVAERVAQDILATGAKIVACGDPGQLAPVEGKQFFSKADFTLRTIHRQALESPIIRQAHAVRSGGTYEADGAAFRVVKPGRIDPEAVMNAGAVLCWTNKTRKAVNARLREMKQLSLLPFPQVGEPIMCLKNARDFQIYNGAVYTLNRPFIEGDTSIVLDVDGDRVEVPNVTFADIKSALKPGVEATSFFDFGYAMTVHKAQGSEWGEVVLIDEYRREEQRAEWLYTAITRAADRITIIA